MDQSDYDVLIFYPNPNDLGGLEIKICNYTGEHSNGVPIDNNENGHCWSVALFKFIENKFTHYDTFEGIFLDPITYVKNLSGCGLYGAIAKKTDRSSNWIDDYVKDVAKKYEEKLQNSLKKEGKNEHV